MNNPNPNCLREYCRFSLGFETTTSMYYAPGGNIINSDGNINYGENNL